MLSTVTEEEAAIAALCVNMPESVVRLLFVQWLAASFVPHGDWWRARRLAINDFKFNG